MITCILEYAAMAAFLASLIWFVILVLSDADVSLTLRTKFGKQPESLSGQVVWITGASSGIGEFLAYRLAEAGCRLVLSARREVELIRVKEACLAAEKCTLKSEDILVLPLDVVDFDSHINKVEQVLKYFKKIDILINNAGKSQRAEWTDVELAVDRDLFDVNVLGPVSLTQAVLPHMKERRQGHVVVVSSVSGKMGAPLSRSYTGCKHAVQGYFDCLRTEIASDNIDVTLICPGPVYSNLFEEAATGKAGEVMGKKQDLTEKRMTTERCAYLSCVAIANRHYETWISQMPILLIVYMFQFLPGPSKWLMAKVGLKQLMKIREGK